MKAGSRVNRATDRLTEVMLDRLAIYVSTGYVSSSNVTTSYSDECSTDPLKSCNHCTDSECRSTYYDVGDNIHLSYLHHSNMGNILHRMTTPAGNKTYRMLFVGKKLCEEIDGKHHNDYAYGVCDSEKRYMLVDCFDSVEKEQSAVVHEFGHALGAVDHYSVELTDWINAEMGYGANEFFSYDCIYGPNRGNANVYNNCTICAGCYDLITLFQQEKE